jgi:hypothetical protein
MEPLYAADSVSCTAAESLHKMGILREIEMKAAKIYDDVLATAASCQAQMRAQSAEASHIRAALVNCIN